MTDHGDKRQGLVGIVGAGLMGGGIAALICVAGLPVKVFDEDTDTFGGVEDNIDNLRQGNVNFDVH